MAVMRITIAQLDAAEQPAELRTIESDPLQSVKSFEMSLLYKSNMIVP